MKFLKLCAARLRALFRKQQMDREMNDEMRFHLEMQIKDNLEAGMSPEQARPRRGEASEDWNR